MLSARFTKQPQRWALIPAVFMGAGELVLLALGTTARMGVGRLVSGSDFGTLPSRSRVEMRAAVAAETQVRGTPMTKSTPPR